MSRGPWWPENLRPCGTPAAWRRHHRRGEPKDPACTTAWNTLRQAQRQAARRTGHAKPPPGLDPPQKDPPPPKPQPVRTAQDAAR